MYTQYYSYFTHMDYGLESKLNSFPSLLLRRESTPEGILGGGSCGSVGIIHSGDPTPDDTLEMYPQRALD